MIITIHRIQFSPLEECQFVELPAFYDEACKCSCPYFIRHEHDLSNQFVSSFIPKTSCSKLDMTYHFVPIILDHVYLGVLCGQLSSDSALHIENLLKCYVYLVMKFLSHIHTKHKLFETSLRPCFDLFLHYLSFKSETLFISFPQYIIQAISKFSEPELKLYRNFDYSHNFPEHIIQNLESFIKIIHLSFQNSICFYVFY